MRRLMAALAVVVAVGACGSGDAKSANVDMRLIALRPERLSVKAATRVTWHQHDAGVHTVTSGVVHDGSAGVTTEPDRRFDSGPIATGKSFAFTFAATGTYPYFCAVHPATMRGVITVT